MSSDGDWSESLFESEKSDSLGGSWGSKQDEPDLAPVAWDKLPEAPKTKPRARLATPAPGSQKESGLLDIKTLAPDLAKGMNSGDPLSGGQGSAPPAGLNAGLLPETPNLNSGLVSQDDRGASERSGANAELEAIANNASASMNAMNRNSLASSSLNDKPVLPPEDYELDAKPSSNQGTLLVIMALLAVAVAGLAVYVLSQ